MCELLWHVIHAEFTECTKSHSLLKEALTRMLRLKQNFGLAPKTPENIEKTRLGSELTLFQSGVGSISHEQRGSRKFRMLKNTDANPYKKTK